MRFHKMIPFKIIILAIFILSGLSLALAQDELPVIRIASGEGLNLSSIISDIVYARLEEKGYDLEVTKYPRTPFKVEAVANDQADIADETSRPVWLAKSQGVPLLTVIEDIPSDFVIVGSTDIQSCEDWDGQSIAYHNDTSFTLTVGGYYFENICPDATPEIVFISGGANRAAALLSGAIDATIIRIASALTLIEDDPEGIHIVSNLALELPWLVGSGVHVSEDFIENHSDVVQEIVMTYIEVYREIIDDPESLLDDVVEQLDIESELAAQIIQAYVDSELFNAYGGLTEERVTQSLEFFIDAGFLPEGLTSEDVVDMSFIENALEELDSE